MNYLPPYSSFPILQNQNIELVKIDELTLSQIVEINFYDGKPAQDLEEAKAMNQRIEMDYLAGNSIHWGIIDKGSRRAVGTCGYYRGFENNSGEIGCVLMPEAQGKGLMTQALEEIINFGFDQMSLSKIWAETSKENLPAQRLLKRLNFVQTESVNGEDLFYEKVNLTVE